VKKYYGKIILSLLVLIFISIFCISVRANNYENIEFRISLEKNTFLLDEPPWMTLEVTNNTKYEISILPLQLDCLECLKVILVNSKGDTLRYRGIHFELVSLPKGVIVKPKQTYQNSVNLLQGFGENLDNFQIRHYLEPDSYTAQAFSSDSLSSNKIVFNVEVPKGNEKEANDLLRQTYEYDVRLDNYKVIEKLQQLIEKYPKSVYMDLATYELAGHYGEIGQPENTYKYLEKLILNSPNSYLIREAFWGLLKPKTDDHKIKFLQDIRKKIPANTKASNWAQKTLESLLRESEKKEK
jgi:tetratricopeptide (TPR) repeat protein